MSQNYQNCGIPKIPTDREMEARKAAEELFPCPPTSSKLFSEYIEEARNSFMLGARWADAHPYVEHVIPYNSFPTKIEDLNITEYDER